MNPICKEIRKDILTASKMSGNGHIPTCFSVVEMLYAVYQSMKHDPKNPSWSERDIFVLSKGHASLAHYCVLARLGYFPVEDVRTFGGFQSRFGCHEDRFKVPGIEVSTGSLGHGIGVATGIALALKLKASARRVYVLIGDGESNEGSVWEAIMIAVNLKLQNLTYLYDNNHSQVRCLQIPNPVERFESFGCEVCEAEGHDVSLLMDALSKPRSAPKVIVANTAKGYGCRTFVQDMFAWHRRSMNDQEFEQLMNELTSGVYR